MPTTSPLLHAELLQRAREAFDVAEQLRVGDDRAPARPRPASATPPAPRARDHVPIEAVVGDVQRPAREPLVERRIIVVEHARPALEPLELLRLRLPPAQRVSRRALVHLGSFSSACSRNSGGGSNFSTSSSDASSSSSSSPAAYSIRSTSRHSPGSSSPVIPLRRGAILPPSSCASAPPLPLCQARPSGTVGSTVCPKVEFTTAANDAYHAAAAVARPR